jgi:single-stranded DNA-binding protein
MNRVQLVGDIVWPVEVWTDSATGRTFGRIMLAVSADTDPLVFVPLILQGSEATDAGMYLGEGSRVNVSAHLHSSLVTYHDANYNRRMRRVVRVIADSVTYLNLCTPQSGDRL